MPNLSTLGLVVDAQAATAALDGYKKSVNAAADADERKLATQKALNSATPASVAAAQQLTAAEVRAKEEALAEKLSFDRLVDSMEAVAAKRRAMNGGLGQLTDSTRAMTLAQIEAIKINEALDAGITKLPKGINAVRGSVTAMAASILQTAPGVAQLSGALGNLALGAAPTIAILAGAAAIGAAWSALTKESRELAKAQDEATASLHRWYEAQQQGAAGQFGATVETASKKVALLRTELDALNQRLQAAQNAPPVSEAGASSTINVFDARAQAKLQKEYDAKAREVAAGEAHVTELQRAAYVDALTALVQGNRALASERASALALLQQDQAKLAALNAQAASQLGPVSPAQLQQRVQLTEEIKKLGDALTPTTTKFQKLDAVASIELERQVALNAAFGQSKEALAEINAAYDLKVKLATIDAAYTGQQATQLRSLAIATAEAQKQGRALVATQEAWNAAFVKLTTGDLTRPVDEVAQAQQRVAAAVRTRFEAEVASRGAADEQLQKQREQIATLQLSGQAAHAAADEFLYYAKVREYLANGATVAQAEADARTFVQQLNTIRALTDATDRWGSALQTVSDTVYSIAQAFGATNSQIVSAVQSALQFADVVRRTNLDTSSGDKSKTQIITAGVASAIPIIGAVVSGMSALLSAQRQRHEAEVAASASLHEFAQRTKEAAQSFHDRAAGNPLQQEITAITTEFKQIINGLVAAGGKDPFVANRTAHSTIPTAEDFARAYADYATLIEAAKKKAEVEKQYAAQDLAARLAAATGHEQEAAAIRQQVANERELEQARLAGATAAELAYIAQVQEAEAAKRLADATAEAAKKLADQLEQITRTVESLTARGLAASGNTRGAEDARLFASQRQELADAIKEGASPQTLALIAFTQFMEREQLKTQRLIEDQTKALTDKANSDLADLGVLADAIRAADAADQKRFAEQIDAERKRADAEQKAYDAQIAAIRDQTKAQTDALDAQAKDVRASLDAQRAQTQAIQAAAQASQQAFNALQQYQQSFGLGENSTLSPLQKLQQTRQQFSAASAAALGGDATAAGQVPALAQAFLDASRKYNASGAGFVADFTTVQTAVDRLTAQYGAQTSIDEQQLAALEASATALEQQLDALGTQKQAIQDASAAQIDAIQKLKDDAKTQSDERIRALQEAKDKAHEDAQKALEANQAEQQRIRDELAKQIDAVTKTANEALTARVQAESYYATYERLTQQQLDAANAFYDDWRRYQTLPRNPLAPDTGGEGFRPLPNDVDKEQLQVGRDALVQLTTTVDVLRQQARQSTADNETMAAALAALTRQVKLLGEQLTAGR